MSINLKSSATMLAGAAALVLAGCASDDKNMAKKMDHSASKDAMGQCHNVNSCKGTSACATAKSACAGQNSCKGQGWVSASKADCDAKGGKFVAKKGM